MEVDLFFLVSQNVLVGRIHGTLLGTWHPSHLWHGVSSETSTTFFTHQIKRGKPPIISICLKVLENQLRIVV